VARDLSIAVDKPHALVARAKHQRAARILRRHRVPIGAEAHAGRVVSPKCVGRRRATEEGAETYRALGAFVIAESANRFEQIGLQ
jgi:hypothetical protein